MTQCISKSSAPFVSRENELRQLHQILSDVISMEKTKFVLIQGDVGVGKTALLEHFRDEVIANNSSILIGEAKCAMEKENNGLLPFTHIFKSLTDQAIKRNVIIGNILDFVKEFAPAWLDIFTSGAATATMKKLEERGMLTTRSLFSQDNVFFQFTNALNRLTAKHPAILFIDDLHWADTSSLELLFHISRYLQDRALMIIGTYRPVEAMESGANAALFRDIRANMIRYGTLELEICQGIDVIKYVAQRYRQNKFSTELISRIQESTGGHALFVSQLFSLWEETGIIISNPSNEGVPIWDFKEGTDLHIYIPPSLREVLDERIRLMEKDLKEILSFASVEGENFTVQVIANLRQLDDLKVYDNLKILEERYKMINDQGSKNINAILIDFYRFAHRFFRDHIYSKLSGGEKRILHKQVGECLEALYQNNDEIAGQLALHFKEAHELIKSVQYALRAAKFEHSRYALSEESNWCEFGLALIDELPDNLEIKKIRLDLLEQSGHSFQGGFKVSDAYRRFHEALSLAKEIQVDTERIARICLLIADTSESLGKYDESMKFIEEGKQMLINSSVPFGEIHLELESLWAIMQERLGNNDSALIALQKILIDFEKLPKTRTLEFIKSCAYGRIGIVMGDLGLYSEAISAYQKCIEIYSKYDALLDLGFLDMACFYLQMGDLKNSIYYIEKGEELGQKLGDLGDIAYAKTIRGDLLLSLGKFQESVNELTNAIEISEQIDALWYISHMYASLALAYLNLSELEKAHQKASCAVKYAEDIPFQIEAAYAHDALAQVEAVRKDWQSATKHFEKAIEIHQKSGHRHMLARSQRHFGNMLFRQGNSQKAIELVKAAMATFQELNLEYEIAETKKLIDNYNKKEI